MQGFVDHRGVLVAHEAERAVLAFHHGVDLVGAAPRRVGLAGGREFAKPLGVDRPQTGLDGGDGGCVGCIVLAALAREAVGDDELGHHQAHGVTEPSKLAHPMVGAGAGLHADQAGRQRGDEFEQLAARDIGAHQRGLARLIHAVNGENVLCQIDANGYDCHGLPLPANA